MLPERISGQLEVDVGFAAASNAMKEFRTVGAVVELS